VDNSRLKRSNCLQHTRGEETNLRSENWMILWSGVITRLNRFYRVLTPHKLINCIVHKL